MQIRLHPGVVLVWWMSLDMQWRAQITVGGGVGNHWVHQNFYSAGELHSGRDPGVDGQEEEHSEYVRHCPCRPWQINSDRLTCVQSRYHCLLPGWWDPLYRHQKRWTRTLHYHQINVSVQFSSVRWLWLPIILWWESRSNEWLVDHRRFSNDISDHPA